MPHLDATTPHFSIPFRFSGGAVVITEQDSEEEILDCIETVLRYEQGYRIEKPEFGIPDQVFAEPVPDSERIMDSLDRWEPRAETVVSAEPDIIDALISRVRVGYNA